MGDGGASRGAPIPNVTPLPETSSNKWGALLSYDLYISFSYGVKIRLFIVIYFSTTKQIRK